MLSRLCYPPTPPSPNPTHGAELWGAESLQSPTLTGPPARGSSNALLLQFLYIWGKKPHLLPCGSISFTLTRHSLVLVLSLFRSSAVVNLYFLCPKSASVLSSCYSWYFWTWNCLQLEFSDNHRFKGQGEAEELNRGFTLCDKAPRFWNGHMWKFKKNVIELIYTIIPQYNKFWMQENTYHCS